MSDREDIHRPEVEKLVSLLNNYQFSSKKALADSTKHFFDVDIFYGFIAIFKDVSSSGNIFNICKQFYDGYISGDRNLRCFVTLLIPTMLNSYLTDAHQELVFEKQHASNETSTKSSADFDALSIFLSKLSQLAPNCFRSPESRRSDELPFSELVSNSIFHNEHSCDLNSLTCFTSSHFHTSSSSNQLVLGSLAKDPISQSLMIASCLLLVYSDTLLQHLSNTSREWRACTLLSLKTFCDCVRRFVSFDDRPRILTTPYFLSSLINSIDSLLFLLNFDFDFRFSDPRRHILPGNYARQLRPILFNLLYKIERMAVYQCFPTVILLCSAVRSMWISRFKRMPSYLTASERNVDFNRPVSFELSERSFEKIDKFSLGEIAEETLVEPTGDSSISHTKSVIRNATFKPQCVPEDIPISTKSPIIPPGNTIFFSEQLTRSLNNLSDLGHLNDPDSGNVRRARGLSHIALKFWHHKP